jgi:Lysozyme like domain
MTILSQNNRSSSDRRVTCRRLLAQLAAVGLISWLGLIAATSAHASVAAPHMATAAAVTPASEGPGALPNPAAISASTESTCAVAAFKAGFRYTPNISTNDGSYPPILVAIAVGLAESSCNPSASYTNSNGCVDRGLWQIDSCDWANVSNACAYQAQCNGDAAWNISGAGADWGPWTTYNTGAWENYISDARSVLSNGYVIELRDLGNGTCINFSKSNGGNGGVVQQWQCLSASPQEQLKVEYESGDNPILADVGNGTCINFSASNGGNGGVIQQWKCLYSSPQEQIRVEGSGELNTNGDADALLQDVGNGTCINFSASNGGNGGRIQQWQCLSASPQEELN